MLNAPNASSRRLSLAPESRAGRRFQSTLTGITVLAEDPARAGYRFVKRTNDIGHLAGIEGHVPLNPVIR